MVSAIVLIIGCIFINLVKNSNVSYLVGDVFIGIFSLTYVWELSINKKLGKLVKPLIIGYLFRLFFLFLDIFGKGIITLPNSGADSEVFYYEGIMYSRGLFDSSAYIIKLVGYLFKTFGENRLFVQFILMLFSIVALQMAAKSLVLLNVDMKLKVEGMYVLALLPNFAMISSFFLRESVVAMFASVSLYCFVRWFTGFSWINYLLAFAFVFGGALFHSGIVGMAIGYILVLLLYDKNLGKVKMSFRTVIPAILLLVAFVYLFNNYSEMFFGKMLGVNSVEDVANLHSDGGASYAQYVGNSNSISNLIMYTPLRMLFFLGSPFIWQLRGVADVIALLFNSLFYLYVIYNSIKYLSKSEMENKGIVFCLLVIGLTTAFVFAWGVSNTGTAIRHRDKMAILYGILLALTGGLPMKFKLRSS